MYAIIKDENKYFWYNKRPIGRRQYHLPLGFINHDIAKKEVFYSVIIIPQVSFDQSDCSIRGQYEVILPFWDEKYHPEARFIENVNKVDVKRHHDVT